ncbi:MAG: cation:proton antiporter [Gammaproteobacteria bacterium]|nr:cation:proton antiporter [Gammaproteobacteria bacterium]
MLALWLAGAFALGVLVKQFGLPPLVGFLAAGFAFGTFGAEPTPTLIELSEAGVLLLLFAVGLKLRFKNLVRFEVWGTAMLHLAIMTLVAGASLHYLAGLAWSVALMLGTALGFSSTVLAAKMLESRSELRAFHGRVAIGILIVQDLVAVALLAATGGHTPSPYALLVLLLPLTRPLLARVLDLVGHDELLVLFGAVLALVAGGWVFETLGLGSELGALLLGTMLSDHRRAQELSNAIWGLKEFLLIGFFLSIGLSGTPTSETLIFAGVATLLMPLKALLFFWLLLRFGLRSRSAFIASLSLASYSEFGLIVAANATEAGVLDPQWLVFAALVVALSFAISAPLNRIAHSLFERFEGQLRRFELPRRHPDDSPISLGEADLVIFGMGRTGTGAFNYLVEQGLHVVGVDSDPGKIERHLALGRRVIYGDLEDPDFWDLLNTKHISAILLAVPDLPAKVFACRQLRKRGFNGLLSATYLYEEERDQIIEAGCDVTHSYFAEAGTGFAISTLDKVKPSLKKAPA